MSKLSKQLVTLARQGGGSFKTVSDRSRIASRLSQRLANLNIQVRDIRHIKTSHIEKYIQSRQSENISSRTLQNEMSAIRSILHTAGRIKLADPHHEQLSNKSLGIAGAIRDGTKSPISDENLNMVIRYATKKDEGVALAVQLARHLGLRTEETIQSVKSLKTWQRSLLNDNDRIRIVFGTKGGRPRDTTVIHQEKVISILNKAIAFCEKNNGKLIDKPNLHSAIDRYRNIIREAGMKGDDAPHSLRYAYSQDAKLFYKQKGFTEKEIFAQVSVDLGHGDGRGRYVKQVYFKGGDDE